MTDVILKIDELKPSASNVRAKHTAEAIAMMAHSISKRGLINPIAVALNGDGKYEVIAGRLRYEGAKKAGIETVRCLDISAFTEAEKVEVSLSENIDRRQMSALEEYVAFNHLFKAGMTVPTIASRFEKDERTVQQILAIGSLPKKIINLAEAGDIGDRTLKALAIASGKDVVRYSKLTAKERPRDWDIQKWLAGADGMYQEKYALFDTALYVGPKTVDLFAEQDEVWLTDGTQFLALQATAINNQLNKYTERGWKNERVEFFDKWQYEKKSKKNGGRVYWQQNSKTGEVSFYEGYARLAKAGKAPKEKGKEGEAAPKPATSQAFDRYMAEVRHAAVQRHMIDNKRAGLVATLILLLKECDNIGFRSGGAALTDEQRLSLINSDNFLVVHDDFKEMLKELGIKEDNRYDIKIDKVAAILMEQTLPTLEGYIIKTVARKWDYESKDGDAIGKAIGLTQVNIWEADAAFWDGIKNKDTLIKIAKENKIPIDPNATAKVIRAIVSEKISDDWRPTWLKF